MRSVRWQCLGHTVVHLILHELAPTTQSWNPNRKRLCNHSGHTTYPPSSTHRHSHHRRPTHRTHRHARYLGLDYTGALSAVGLDYTGALGAVGHETFKTVGLVYADTSEALGALDSSMLIPTEVLYGSRLKHQSGWRFRPRKGWSGA